MKRYLNKKTIIIGAGLIIGVVALLTYYQFFVFRITKIMPAPNQMPAVAPFIDIYFNEPIDKLASVDSPQKIVRQSEVTGKKVRILLQPMASGKNYQIDLKGIASKDGSTMAVKTIKFQAQNINVDDLPEDVRKAILEFQDIKGGSTVDDPLSSSNALPYYAPNFELRAYYTQSTSTPSILFVYQPTVADLRAGESAHAAAVKAAKDYLASKNIDLKKYNFVDKSTPPTGD